MDRPLCRPEEPNKHPFTRETHQTDNADIPSSPPIPLTSTVSPISLLRAHILARRSLAEGDSPRARPRSELLLTPSPSDPLLDAVVLLELTSKVGSRVLAAVLCRAHPKWKEGEASAPVGREQLRARRAQLARVISTRGIVRTRGDKRGREDGGD